MKINLIDYIRKAGETTSLSALEQEKLGNVLTEYMAMKPVRSVSRAKDARPTGVRGGLFSSLPFIHLKKRYMPIAIILALVLSGSASYAAEGSMPGDLLYPVKVSVNEKVGAALAVSAESKAELQAKLAGRRLAEATRLAADSKLTADASSKLSSDFAAHADSAVAHTKELEKKNASVAIGFASNFESSLTAHEALLAEVNSEGDTDDLRALVRAKALLVSKFRMDAEGDAEVSARSNESIGSRKAVGISEVVKVDTRVKEETALAMGRNVKSAIKDAETALARVEARLDATTVANAKAQIRVALELAANGDALYKSADFTGAFHTYQDALVTVRKLSVYLNASSGVNIRILAPVQPSPQTERGADGSTETNDDADTPPESREILLGDIEVDSSTNVEVETNVGSSNMNVGGSGSGSVNIGL